jgi:hypothetical protein
MSDRAKVAARAKNIVLVPLNKLKKSPKNVRKVPHTGLFYSYCTLIRHHEVAPEPTLKIVKGVKMLVGSS